MYTSVVCFLIGLVLSESKQEPLRVRRGYSCWKIKHAIVLIGKTQYNLHTSMNKSVLHTFYNQVLSIYAGFLIQW